jgi:3-oxoadipate enol-lactonase
MPSAQVNGVELHYEVAGEGPPLLFIHGLGSSGQDWKRQAPAFTSRFRVITFDVRGHGASSKPHGPYTIPLFARDTAALLKELGAAPAHVAGLSMGGMIAFQLAVDAPELVRTMTIVNSGPAMVLRTFKERLPIKLRFATVRWLGLRAFAKQLVPRLFPKPEQEDLRQEFSERIVKNDKRAYLDSLRALLGWSVLDRIGEIRCPTLIVASDHDYTPVSYKEAYAKLIPGAELKVIEDSWHAAPMDRPRELNALLAEFLARHERVECSRTK